MRPSSRRMTVLVPIAVLASSLTACGSDTADASDASDASTSTQLKGTAVKGESSVLATLMESGKPAGDYRYTDDHMWVRRNADGTVEFGLTNFAQEALGDIVYLDLPKPRTNYKANSACGSLESTKSMIDIVTPLDGFVTEINKGLIENPGKINDDPYGSWLIRLAPDSSTAFDSLSKTPT